MHSLPGRHRSLGAARNCSDDRWTKDMDRKFSVIDQKMRRKINPKELIGGDALIRSFADCTLRDVPPSSLYSYLDLCGTYTC
ncbi:hypothetical protein PENTCL1PPCAC_12668, partial [Pristionchus entomophagus]